MTKPTKVIIKSFHPLDVTLPDCTELVGIVQIVLPAIHVQLLDLSMDGIVPGNPHLGTDAPLHSLEIDFPEPVDVGKFMMFVIESREELEQMWKGIQAHYDEKGALL
ncbi:MAG: hypothetical protein ACYSUV_20675 [Planctomycetota bacterium]